MIRRTEKISMSSIGTKSKRTESDRQLYGSRPDLCVCSVCGPPPWYDLPHETLYISTTPEV